jgi:hypothetical protein
MNAEVPYLARLARQAAGQAMLWPPRQLFNGNIDMPVDVPDGGGSPQRYPVNAATSLPGPLVRAATGEEQIASDAVAPAHGADIEGGSRADLEPGSAAFAGPTAPPGVMPVTSAAPPPLPGATVTPVTSAAPALEPGAGVTPVTSAASGASVPPVTSAGQGPAGGIPVPRGAPDMHWPPQVASRRHSSSHSGPLPADQANSAGARPVAPPKEPQESSKPRAGGGTGRAQSSEPWAGPLWGAPVDLPEAVEFTPKADEAARRMISPSPAGPAAPSSGPAAAAIAASRDGHQTDNPGALVVRGAAGYPVPGAEAAAAPNWPREPAPVRNLIPPTLARTRPAPIPGSEPDEPHRKPRVSGQPNVSIGTIEVTVISPASPTPAAREAQPSPPVTRGWSRPPSLLASSAGRDRMRDGLRRWYGTAQG